MFVFAISITEHPDSNRVGPDPARIWYTWIWANTMLLSGQADQPIIKNSPQIFSS